MSNEDDLIVAIDGGQSSTLALVATLNGVVVGAGLAGPSNHYHEPGGAARLENALRNSTTMAMQNAGRAAQSATYACLGMTGSAAQARDIMQTILPRASVQSHDDMVTALAGASVGQPGVVVISGTGAVAYGRRDDGRDAKAGGWGYIMGDEGSGYDIGRGVLRAATQASDGRGRSTELLLNVPAHFGLATLDELLKAVYSAQITRPQIASLASVAAAAARNGDGVARQLLESAGRDLAKAALAVIARLDMLDAGMTVYQTGGVFGAGAFILEPFETALGERSAASTVRLAAFSPAIGALLMALQAAGVTLNDRVIHSVRESLPQSAIAKHQEKET